MTACPGLLELFHPDGAVAAAEVIGSACPDRLRPRSSREPPWDLVVLAPSGAEARSSAWIRDTMSRVTRSLQPDGLVYVIGSPEARLRLTRALGRAGITPAEYLVHLPDPARSELLLPVRVDAIRHAADVLLSPSSPRRRAVRLAAAVPGAARLLAHAHPSVGILAGRGGDRPLAAWLPSASGGQPHQVTIVQTRWRADRARAVLHLAAVGTITGAVAKVALRTAEATTDMRREALALATLGPPARAAGAAVPQASLVQLTTCCPALLLEALPGESAARALTRRPSRVPVVLRRLGRWLEDWSRATCRPRVVDRALLDAWVLGPAERLAEMLGEPEYLRWLDARCRALAGRTVPLVATHNDLTMANVLLQRDDGFGVLDWEAATGEGLPLRDFAYAAVDATAAGEGYRDRPAAWTSCFGPPGPRGVVGEVLERLRRAVGVSDELATIAFHACWLQHAENERPKRTPGEPLPFLECARLAASLRWEA